MRTYHIAWWKKRFSTLFLHVVMRRHATREIVQVNFKTTTAAARTWAVFGNHWPSRSGQFESEGYRAIAGETLGYFHQRVLEVHGPLAPVLAMGGRQRRTVRPFACATCAQHPAAGQGHLCAGKPASVESHVADRWHA